MSPEIRPKSFGTFEKQAPEPNLSEQMGTDNYLWFVVQGKQVEPLSRLVVLRLSFDGNILSIFIGFRRTITI